MEQARFGLQLWSVREAMQENLLATLENLAQMGYEAVQFAGFNDIPAETVKGKLRELNLQTAGAHVGLTELVNNLDETLQFHETIENDVIIIPWIPEDMRETAADYEITAAILNDLGKTLHEKGFTLAYHNHDFEFEKQAEQTGFEIIFQNTDPTYVKIELDCYWAASKGFNPVEIIKSYADRCISLHIKDMTKVDGDNVSTELLQGRLPLQTYIDEGKKVGIPFYVVEQEFFTGEPLDSARKNANTMKQLLMK